MSHQPSQTKRGIWLHRLTARPSDQQEYTQRLFQLKGPSIPKTQSSSRFVEWCELIVLYSRPTEHWLGRESAGRNGWENFLSKRWPWCKAYGDENSLLIRLVHFQVPESGCEPNLKDRQSAGLASIHQVQQFNSYSGPCQGTQASDAPTSRVTLIPPPLICCERFWSRGFRLGIVKVRILFCRFTFRNFSS